MDGECRRWCPEPAQSTRCGARTETRIRSAAFVREKDTLPAMGTLTLYINDEAVGSGQIMTQPGNFSLVGEGLNAGKIRWNRSQTTTQVFRLSRSPGARSTRLSLTCPASPTSTSRRKPSR